MFVFVSYISVPLLSPEIHVVDQVQPGQDPLPNILSAAQWDLHEETVQAPRSQLWWCNHPTAATTQAIQLELFKVGEVIGVQ